VSVCVCIIASFLGRFVLSVACMVLLYFSTLRVCYKRC